MISCDQCRAALRPDERVFIPVGTTETLDDYCAEKSGHEQFVVFSLDAREGVVMERTDLQDNGSVNNDTAKDNQERKPTGTGQR